MASAITKKELEHLATLARLELTPHEEEKLLNDLAKILDHFKELTALDTSHVTPMTGGTHLKNAFREDGAHAETNKGKGIEQFPDKKDGFLVIPPVFE
jgi:aspartyl-tRNA(Asn)/glutamyl-tRNA(Gln) amidotransferase subunit C